MSTPEYLLRWLEQQSFFPECLGPEDVDQAKQARLEQLAGWESLALRGNEHSFVVWETGLVEQDTGRSVCSLWGYQGTPQEVEALLQGAAREFDDQTLMVEVPYHPLGSSDRDLQEVLTKTGFVKTRYRLLRRPQQHNLDTPRQGRYRLRQGTELDRSFLCRLATDHVVHTLPPDREKEIATYTQAIFERFMSLDLGPDSPFELLIADLASNHTAVGYILLELQGERVHLVDLGVRQSQWGQYVAQFLVRATENLLLAHDITHLHTEISAANRRSFVTACRSLKFEPLVVQWLRSP